MGLQTEARVRIGKEIPDVEKAGSYIQAEEQLEL